MPNRTEKHKKILDLSNLYAYAPCGYFSALPNGIIVKINVTLLQLLGYEEDELLGKRKWQELLSIGGKIYHETHYAPLLQMQGYVKEVNFDFVRKDKIKVPVVLNATQINDAQGTALLVNVIVCEMQQRKQYEKELMLATQKSEDLIEQLSAKNTELAKFAYIVSHDLKQPLNNIIGLVDLLQNEYTEQLPKEGQLFIEHISKSAQKLSELIDSILIYYRGNTAETIAKKEPVDFTHFIENILSLLNSENTHSISYPQNNNIVYINIVLLERIFINLLTNSIKYNDKEKVIIKITLTENADYYIFSLKDNGIGISKEDQKKLFNLFTTLGKKDRNGNFGTGIGLATIKKLIESQGGSIKIESELGLWTLFEFTIKK